MPLVPILLGVAIIAAIGVVAFGGTKGASFRDMPLIKDRFAVAAEAARKAGVSPDVYALARIAASEDPRKEAKIQKMYVAINDAKRLGWLHNGKPDVYRLATYTIKKEGGKVGIDKDRIGIFGKQKGRRYATTNEPKPLDLQLAQAVWDKRIPDMTKGAVKFIDPASLAKQEGVTKTFAQIDETWRKGGLKPHSIPGIKGTIFYA